MNRVVVVVVLLFALVFVVVDGGGDSKESEERERADRGGTGTRSPASGIKGGSGASVGDAVTALEKAASVGCSALADVAHPATGRSFLFRANCNVARRVLTGLEVKKKKKYGPAAIVDFVTERGAGDIVFALDRTRAYKVIALESHKRKNYAVGTKSSDDQGADDAAGKIVSAYRTRDCAGLASYARSQKAAALLRGQSGSRCLPDSGLQLNLAADKSATPEAVGKTSGWSFYTLKPKGGLYTLVLRHTGQGIIFYGAFAGRGA